MRLPQTITGVCAHDAVGCDPERASLWATQRARVAGVSKHLATAGNPKTSSTMVRLCQVGNALRLEDFDCSIAACSCSSEAGRDDSQRMAGQRVDGCCVVGAVQVLGWCNDGLSGTWQLRTEVGRLEIEHDCQADSVAESRSSPSDGCPMATRFRVDRDEGGTR